MGHGYILSLDQSTAGSKAMIVDKTGQVIAKEAMDHHQYYPNPGWVEHDPMEIYENCKKILKKMVEKANLKPSDMDVLAITNQRETVVVWDKTTGLPVHNAIVWQCRRTSAICADLKKQGFEQTVKDKTGLVLDPYFSATKVKWILENTPGAMQGALDGNLLLGTIDTWLIWKLTRGKVHATDYTNASRTLVFNIQSLQWDHELLEIFNIPKTMLGTIKSSNDLFGATEKGELFESSIPISGVIGDSQGALFGQNCFESGMIKATYGTGSSILMNIGEKYTKSQGGLVTSIAWGINGKVEYVLEGIIHSSGDTLKWVRDNLELFDDFDNLEKMLDTVDSTEGVYMVPAFVGLGIPYWDAEARAAIVGMSRSARKEHIVRAAVESIAYQVRDAVDTMGSESGIHPKELRVDGGATMNSFLMQFQADMLNIKVIRTEIAELSAMGSVYLAGLGIGLWKSKEAIQTLRREGESFIPSMKPELREQVYQGWKVAVNRVLSHKSASFI